MIEVIKRLDFKSLSESRPDRLFKWDSDVSIRPYKFHCIDTAKRVMLLSQFFDLFRNED